MAIPPFFILGLLLLSAPAMATDGLRASPSLLGPLGLNTVPSARMDAAGTIRAGVTTLDPYAHALLSIQVAEPLNVTLRQTAETSSLRDDADRLYPGIDLKLRLARETRFMPELSLGAIGAFGHKRMAGEYLALSKRYESLDFTAGMGWGRYGTAGHIRNPLRVVGNHFQGQRPLDGEMPSGPEDWFTGDRAGLFAGIEYHTKYDGLSLKFDWGGDRFIAEKTAFDFSAPSPWSAGFNYAPSDWAQFGIGLVGGDKVMATLSLQTLVQKWQGRNREPATPAPIRPYRTGIVETAHMARDAARQGRMILHSIRRTATGIWARMDADPGEPMPRLLGDAARHMANHAGHDADELYITPEVYGFHGPTLRLMRRDLEMAGIRRQGSAQEIWHNATRNARPPQDMEQGATASRFDPLAPGHPVPKFRFILDSQISLSEEDSGVLHRTAAIFEATERFRNNLMGGIAVRINGPHNIDEIARIRPPVPLPVRSNVARFADKTVTLDRMYVAWTRSYNDGQVHVTGAAGYLEEMYAGFGGEIIYRPEGKTFAIGMELWEALKRDPDSTASTMLNGDHLLSGYLKGWYEVPDTDMTIGIKVGRYLAADIGGTFSIAKTMDNGARIEAFATATDMADIDPWGGATHLHGGLRLTLPLGNIPFLPAGSQARIATAPFGRDYGQSLDAPIPLYETTDPLSARHMIRHWTKITGP